MTRALSVTCLTVGLLLAGAAAVQAKPSIAVLGLEVTSPDNGPVDQQTTAAASNLTLALRDRARAGTGPYDTAPGSDKELIDLKLLNDCSGEAMPCMAKIGNDLGAKFMLYGHVAKQAGAYRVSVTLLNVDNKSKGASKSFDVPVLDLAGGPKGKDTLVWARKIYGEMTGETSQGTVVVRVTGADRGTLLVEENGTWQPKGPITSGVGRVVLPEGKYKIAVESEGFQRWDSTVTVTSGGDTQVPASLVPMPKTDLGTGSGSDVGVGSGSDHSYGGTISDNPGEGWHKAFVGSAITGGVLAVGFGVSWGLLASTGKAQKSDKDPNPGAFDYGGNCDGTKPLTGLCAQGSKLKTATFITGFGALAIGGFAVVALFESRRSSASSKEHASNGHRAHRQLAITPVVGPTGAGASLQFDW